MMLQTYPRHPSKTEKAALLNFILKDKVLNVHEGKSLRDVQKAFQSAAISVFDKTANCDEKVIFILWPDAAKIYDEFYAGVYTMGFDGRVSSVICCMDLD